MSINDTDQFLVNRSNVTSTVTAANLMAEILDDDLMLVNRGDVTYTVTGLEVKDSLQPPGPALDIAAVVAPTDPNVGDTLTVVATASGGTEPYAYTYQWQDDQGSSTWTDITGANSTTYDIPNSAVGWSFRCRAVVTDDNTDTAEATSNETSPAVDNAVAPDLASVSLTENNPGVSPRFTDQTFDVQVTMTEEGSPVSEKTIEARVEGTFSVGVTTAPIESTPIVDGTVKWIALTSAADNLELSADGLDLYCIADTTNSGGARGHRVSSGKHYFEVNVVQPGATESQDKMDIGWGDLNSGNAYWLCDNKRFWAYNGSSWVNTPLSTKAANPANYTVMCAIDATSKKIWYGVDGNWHNNVDPAKGSNSYFNKFPDGPDLCIRMTHSVKPFLPENARCTIIENPQYAPTGFDTTAPYQKLVFETDENLSELKQMDDVRQGDGAATGVILDPDIADRSVVLSESTGTWTVGQRLIGPEKVMDNATKYLEFDSTGNVTDLLDVPQDPPYKTSEPDPSLTLTFPSTFPSGVAPDVELGEGTTLTVEAKAENSAGTSGPKSATVQPDTADEYNAPKWLSSTGPSGTISADGYTLSKPDTSSGGTLNASGPLASGKSYYEIHVTATGADSMQRDIGWGTLRYNNAYFLCSYRRFYNGSIGNVDLNPVAANSKDYVLMCAVDLDANKVWYGVDGNWHNGEDPATGTNTYWTADLSGETIQVRAYVSDNINCNLEIQQNPQYKPDGFNGGVKTMSTEQLEEQALRFQTYEHRKHVACADKAEASRDELIQSLAAQGYTLDEILALI